MIQPSLDTEFGDWFGDLFGSLCIRDLEMTVLVVLGLFEAIVEGYLRCAINSRLRDDGPSASAVDKVSK